MFTGSFFSAGCREGSFSGTVPEGIKSEQLQYMACMWRTWLKPCFIMYVVGKSRSCPITFSSQPEPEGH